MKLIMLISIIQLKINLHSASLGKWNWKTIREAAISKHFLLFRDIMLLQENYSITSVADSFFFNIFNSVCYVCMWKSLSHDWLFVTLGTVAHQASPSTGFPRQECWSGLPFPSPGDLLNPGIEPRVSHIAGRLFASWASREALRPKGHLSGTYYLNDLSFKNTSCEGRVWS